jgi:hypothetical protein
VFHTVFCHSSEAPNGQVFAHWCIEVAVVFDESVTFSPPFEQLDRTDWTAIEVIYDPAKRPIQFERLTGARCAALVEGAIELLRDRGFYRMQADLVAQLQRSKQAFSIEFDELLGSDDIWEFLDLVECRLATDLDGVIEDPEKGFFDRDNRPLCAFS